MTLVHHRSDRECPVRCFFDRRIDKGGRRILVVVLFGTIVFGLASLLDQAVFGRHAPFWATCTQVFLMPYVAVAVRRLLETSLLFQPALLKRGMLTATSSGAQPSRKGSRLGSYHRDLKK